LTTRLALTDHIVVLALRMRSAGRGKISTSAAFPVDFPGHLIFAANEQPFQFLVLVLGFRLGDLNIGAILYLYIPIRDCGDCPTLDGF